MRKFIHETKTKYEDKNNDTKCIITHLVCLIGLYEACNLCTWIPWVTFRHLNIRIAKNNLAYPLLKDTFLVVGSSRCEVLSVLDLNDAFHSLRLSENSKRYMEYYHTLSVHHIYIKECLWD